MLSVPVLQRTVSSSASMMSVPSLASSSTDVDSIASVPSLSETSDASLRLCNKLVELGTSVPSVQPSTIKFAQKFQALWRALDLLCLRLNSEDSVHNENAWDLIEAMCAEVQNLSLIVQTVMPAKTKNLTCRFVVKQRMRSMNKTTGIDAILKRLDFLRSTVELLVATVMIGEKIRWAKAFGRGHGRAQENVMFQTIRLEDKPAKTYLAERVMAVGQAYVDMDGIVVTQELPPFLGAIRQEIREAQSRAEWSEEEYIELYQRMWWDLLLREWTKV